MFLVCGATGTVGGEVLRLLCASSAPTRALVRSPEKADSLRGYDCETAVGDFTDAASLDAALAGTEAVFLASPASQQQVTQECAVIDAASRAGTRVVKLAVTGWESGVTGRIGTGHRQIIDYLAASGLSYAVLAPNDYLQNLFQSAATIQAQGVLAMPHGNAALASIDARDVAAVGVHVLTAGGSQGASFELSGPELLTKAAVAQRISAGRGKTVRYLDADPAQARSGMLGAGMDEWLVEGLMELSAAYRAGFGATITDEVRRATGRDARSVDDFLSDYRRAFA